MIPSRLLNRLSIADLKAAIKHKVQFGRTEALESAKADLLKQVAKLDKKLAKLGSNGSVSTSGKRRRKLSAATRRKMAEAAKARWAKVHGKAKVAPVKRRTMSAAGRAAIAAAQRARWTKAKGMTKTAAVKSAAPAKRRRTLSPATRAKMAAAAKARWAKVKGAKGKS